jgi:hypothetical protein
MTFLEPALLVEPVDVLGGNPHECPAVKVKAGIGYLTGGYFVRLFQTLNGLL